MAGLRGWRWLGGCVRDRLIAASALVVLALMVAGCGGMATAHETTAVHALTGASSRGLYMVTCTPPDGSVRLGQPQTWTVLVTTHTGTPVSHLRLGCSIEMPQMSMAPAPAHSVTAEGQGRYLVRGVEFTMSGRWMMVVTLAGPAHTAADRATFSLRVE